MLNDNPDPRAPACAPSRPASGLSAAIHLAIRLHQRLFDGLERLLAGWFAGFAARLVFASVLLAYYLNSAWGKFGDGPLGFLFPNSGAYVSILPKVMEAYGYDESALPFFYDIVVYLGTWAEIVLPILVVAGLLARLSALGMIGFVVVQSIVDVTGHGLDAASIGAPFDRFPDAIIFDQRLLWVFVLSVVVLAGPGRLSADHLLARLWGR